MKTILVGLFKPILILCVLKLSLGASPSAAPTKSPTFTPSASPSQAPTRIPTANPTLSPTASPTVTPTLSPTFSPTAYLNPQGTQTFVTAPIATLNVEYPIAPHQLVVVQPAGNSLIQLTFYHSSTTNFQFNVLAPPSSGSLFQLSQVFSQYGYLPINGAMINNNNTVVTGSKNRVYYVRPTPDAQLNKKWDSFDFTVFSPVTGQTSFPGTITIVPPSGAIVGSNFLTSSEDWTISGSKQPVQNVLYEKYSRGPLLNYYILGTDDLINVARSADSDNSLWYFEAPSKFFGNYGISYGGMLSFTIGAFSGDFTSLNDGKTNVVILECDQCIGPVGKGITLGYSINALTKSPNGRFQGTPMTISIPLTENAGWLKDSQNTLMPWMPPSQCDVIQVLSRLSRIRILGDWTTWYETVAIDNVQVSNTKGQLPLCSQLKPDASVCDC